ncbi:MAG: SUMF1/EgtB/PvdO family nonheme iron enzyme [Nitrospirae bacterium]|nr:SUMF1/EgtB/PvdO family nonheme iron enzyme [Nitrospirota bacterium]MBF0565571.1 SUMF1/EgtB/PvdO family nonheme iron enzyme [Nitrospirota bacterium]
MKSVRDMLIVLIIVLLVSKISSAERSISIKKESADTQKGIEVVSNPKRIALVIGNASYKDSPLKNPVNDARKMTETLLKLGFDVITKENANQEEMERAVNDFALKLANGDIGLFFYAGHGAEVGGRNYLIPIGAEILGHEIDIKYKTVDVQMVLEKMESAKNKVNIMILDACRNNPLARGFRSLSRGLAAMAAGQGIASGGTIIAYATAAGSVADDGKGNNGVFTEEFSKNITIPGLTIDDVFKRTAKGVREKTSGAQVPFLSTSVVDDIYLASNAQTESTGVSQKQYKSKDNELSKEAPQLEENRKRSEAEREQLDLKKKKADLDEHNQNMADERKKVEKEQLAILDREDDAKLSQEQRKLQEEKNKLESERIRLEKVIKRKEIEAQTQAIEQEKNRIKAARAKVEAERLAMVNNPLKIERATTDNAPYTDTITGMEFVFVRGGCYKMGDTFGDGESYEKPVHEVCVDSFYLGRNEVTQLQWTKIMGNNPSFFKNGDNYPVENVSWNDAKAFINKLNVKTGMKYSLPTEAEWEYACRSEGMSEKYSGGSDADNYAWYDKNSGNKTHPTLQKQSNGLGLSDMSGNVWEWVEDAFAMDAYSKHSRNNPIHIGRSGGNRVIRGGSWSNYMQDIRCSFRDDNAPDYRFKDIGLRLKLER